MSYIAAIDIGSNAIRLAIAHVSLEGGIHLSYRSREPVRLGSSVFSTGSVDNATYEDLKKALLQFRNQLQNHNVKSFRATATSAMREAKNGKEIVKKLFLATGIQVEIISGEEEAQLVSNAISRKIDLKAGNFLLIDIGGGSIELIAISSGKMLKKQSFVLGGVRVLELHKDQSKSLDKWLPKYIEETCADFFEGLPKLDTAVGTGGNMDRFGKLMEHVADPAAESLDFEEMVRLFKKLNAVDYDTRIVKFWLKPDRADVIIPAAIATVKFMQMAKCERIYFPQVGLKDGILYELSSSEEN